ncbi:MAG: hypothetical protein GY768_31130, partial [Planctomycetaceae bacterium]|nr:hypothetical protein [Planctomycetaceae bacterium]
MQPQTMDRLPLHLQETRRERKEKGDHLARLVYVEPVVTAEQDPTISVGRTLGVLREGVVEVSVANLDLERALTAKPENTNARVYPVITELKRLKVTYAKRRPKDPNVDDSTSSSTTGSTTDSSSATTISFGSQISSASDLSQMIPEPLGDYPSEVPLNEWPTRPEYDPERVDMTEDQQERLEGIFNEYTDIFSTGIGDIGRTHLAEHQIILEEGSGYFYETPRRMTPEKHIAADQQVQAYLELGLIEPSYSPYASGIVMVGKKDGDLRMCVDYRKLNDVTIKDRYPLPHIKDTLDSIGNARYFSTFDMGRAFHQIPIRECDRPKTAFVVPGGLFQWKYMPFGLCNAPSSFQRLMANVLAPISKKYGNMVLCYIDDILIATRTIEEHLDRMEEVFQRMREAGLKFKAKKCDIFKKEVKFLGSTITSEGIIMNEQGVEKIMAWATPTNRTELKSFLGFASYYREFVMGFSHIAAPLTALDRKNKDDPKNTSIKWNDEAERAFNELKQAFTTTPILSLPTEEGLYVLDTDASCVAIAGILHQIQPDDDGIDRTRVICYASRALTGPELRYSAAKSELLALVYFCKYFKQYLLGRSFVVRVDNQALVWMKTYSGDTTGQAIRWMEQLASFHFVVDHRTREKHMNADALSKLPHYYEELHERQGRKREPPKEEVEFMPKCQWQALDVYPEDDPDPGHGRQGRKATPQPQPEEKDFEGIPGGENHDQALLLVQRYCANVQRPWPYETGQRRIQRTRTIATQSDFNGQGNKCSTNDANTGVSDTGIPAPGTETTSLIKLIMGNITNPLASASPMMIDRKSGPNTSMNENTMADATTSASGQPEWEGFCYAIYDNERKIRAQPTKPELVTARMQQLQEGECLNWNDQIEPHYVEWDHSTLNHDWIARLKREGPKALEPTIPRKEFERINLLMAEPSHTLGDLR